MTPREAYRVVDNTIARATHLPVSFTAISEALRILHAAIEKLDAQEGEAESGKTETNNR